jgi:DNA-directed RNA polymerase subunit omega
MARFTVADCMENISNRYDMTLAAATRARQLTQGEPCLLTEEKSDKANIIALREIADNRITAEILDTLE